ncbi:hypothetical protein [Dictyobacter kobayashii]|uniref:Exo-alpha-sialidase n=1 Tax=Dictyobacter kobayashii TaxID=2014872 RepID=A0A402AUL9_9CHLR|nr:hypothetical protein [Dictyobacter kobayashii]GCE22784.1 hypothetical protein KDK_65840 [Dictyobacter kobayashii]
MKISQKSAIILIASVLSLVAIVVLAIYLLGLDSNSETATGHVFATPKASQPGKPTLLKLEQVTDQAFGDGEQYVPNSWGAHKDRIIRTSKGDLFMTYISQGDDLNDRQWHLMHKAPNGDWQEIQSGNAGTEPINIVLGKNDSIHLFAWPKTQGKLQHIYSNDNGKTFTSEWLQGNWRDDGEQGYSSVGVNDRGDIVVIQTGPDKPGIFNWTYFSATTNKWTFHHNTLDLRYTYAFLFPGYNNDLSIVATRDVQRHYLNLPQAQDGNPWIFSEVKYFHISDITPSQPSLDQLVIKELSPKNRNDTNDRDLTYVTDSYIDTAGRLHVLYLNEYDGPHQAIIEDGKIVKDVLMPNVSFGQKVRITQDTQGHFYLIAMDEQGKSINIYPGSADDTDGTQLAPVVKIDISHFPGCSDYDFCHSPTFTVPRNGNELSDIIDGVYGNMNKEIYFRINLRGNDKGASQSFQMPFTSMMSFYLEDKKGEILSRAA